MQQETKVYRFNEITPLDREAERLRAKARHDEAQALHHARIETKYEMAKIMIADGEPIEKTIKYTGLTREEVEGLRDQK